MNPHFLSAFCALLLLTLPAVSQAQAPFTQSGKIDPARLVSAARQQIGVTLGYDPEYHALPYPNGDVPTSTGVCTDVITRAFRAQGLDLQRTVHEDMKNHFAATRTNGACARPTATSTTAASPT